LEVIGWIVVLGLVFTVYLDWRIAGREHGRRWIRGVSKVAGYHEEHSAADAGGRRLSDVYTLDQRRDPRLSGARSLVRVLESINIHGIEAAANVSARGDLANALGEGFADGLDVAGF